MEYVYPDRGTEETSNRQVNTGTLVKGPAALPPYLSGANWSQFRGNSRNGIADSGTSLLKSWPAQGLKVIWRIPVGEGHAGAAVNGGRVYLVDYDRDKEEDAIRCLSLADGTEVWRYTYYVSIKRNHGMSRTVPAVNDDYVVALGPMGQVTCLRAETGELVWKMDLVKEYKSVIPPWYAGQCPLIDDGAAIIAPGGDPLMMAVDLASGQIRWRTPNPGDWGMTHSSIMAFDYEGVHQYVYCTTRGVVGVDAADGKILWTHPGWKISIANIPSPVFVPPDRLFFSGGYDSGCQMVRLTGPADRMQVAEVFRLRPDVFGADQQTPILYQDHLFGVIPNGQLACLDLQGKQVWTSGAATRFGIGPYMIAQGMILALADQDGTLHLAEASTQGYRELARAKVLNGHDAWAPMALADGRLLLRDLTEMVCVEVGAQKQ